MARLLLVVFLATTPLATTSIPARAGDEFQDPNQTRFDPSEVALDNSRDGETTFRISAERTAIGWEDLQQPAGNVLDFHFENATDRSAVLNYIGARHPSQLNGTVLSNGTVAFSNPYGIFIGNEAVLDVGSLVAIAGDVSRESFLAGEGLTIPLEGTVENRGLIRAERLVALLGRQVVNAGGIDVRGGDLLMLGGQQLWLPGWDALTADLEVSRAFFAALLAEGRVENTGSLRAAEAALLGGRVAHSGEIEIDDGSLLMVGADAVYLTEFGNPVLIRLPRESGTASGSVGQTDGGAEYAIESHGRIDAGLGHVRLAAADPLGFGIRQGAGSPEAPSSIRARRLTLEGGDDGRVHLAGSLDADARADGGSEATPGEAGETGGRIDVTGSLIVLEDADVTASGPAGGGTIHIGGEQQGQGEMQRARAVVVDAESEVRADALEAGDGGSVIVFAEDFTAVDGTISARGGPGGGDGGFVETSGLRRFSITSAPDLSAPAGRPGLWLIDPFDIEISNAATDCPGDNAGCLNRAVEALLDPDFDDTGFDGILRTVAPDDAVPAPNRVDPELLERALAAGTDITLSTQTFGGESGDELGRITVADGLSISTDETLAGTRATLTLLAAHDILIDDVIEVVPGSDPEARFELSVVLRANDLAQSGASAQSFDLDATEGGIRIAADISTGGGDFSAQGSFISLESGRSIATDGGDIDLRSGLFDENGSAVTIGRQAGDPGLADRMDPVARAPDLTIDGLLDSGCSGGCASGESGGGITLIASSIGVSTTQQGEDPLELVTGRLRVGPSGELRSDGGDIRLGGGRATETEGAPFAGSVEIAGPIDSGGGDVSIAAIRIDPEIGLSGFDVRFVEPDPNASELRGEGGEIDLTGPITTEGGTLAIGGDRTRSVLLDGLFDTTVADDTDNGLFRVIARDRASSDASLGRFGEGAISIGTRAGTTIRSGGLSLAARSITTSDALAPQTVELFAGGATDAELEEVVEGRIDVEGEHQITLGEGTTLTAETVDLRAAPDPTAVEEDERAQSETRLVFAGTNAAGAAASQGVRIHADSVSITVGDGPTGTEDGLADPTERAEEPGVPTDFGLARQSRADYSGLQLRGLDDAGAPTAAERPLAVTIRQDADLTISGAPASAPGVLALADAFGANPIEAGGLEIGLASSDGILSIEDVAGLVDDGGASAVRLNGGLLLPVEAGDPFDADGRPIDQPIVFDPSIPVGALEASALHLGSPGDLRITTLLADRLGSLGSLEIEAGEPSGIPDGARRGDLVIDAGVALQASDRLALRGGASGSGDLVFGGAGTLLAADEIDLRAGQGTVDDGAVAPTLSRIIGLHLEAPGADPQPVSIRDGSGNAFGAAGGTARSFLFRQDAGIDLDDLPSLGQLGLAVATGFTAQDVRYAVRSDQGPVVLDDGVVGTNEAELFRNALLSLVGLESSGSAAIQISSDFDLESRHVELGGVRSFTFGPELAAAFNRSATNGRERITLRSGLGQTGVLGFDAAGQSSVRVVAPRIDLVAGDGAGGGSGSRIDLAGAEFDLTGVPGAEQTFLFQQDVDFGVADLPPVDRFVGGSAGLPDVLAIRTDAEEIALVNVDLALLPLDITDDPGRLVLEGRTLTLRRDDGTDLALTSDPGLAGLDIRLRTNDLRLIALGEDTDGDGARVLAGTAPPPSGVQPDAAFDDEPLLIEAFDDAADLASVGNLSRSSEIADTPGQFDLAQGLGPRAITIEQEGPVLSSSLPDRRSISGLLARSPSSETDETSGAEVAEPAATRFEITSTESTIEIAPENVNGSALVLSADAASADATAFTFLPGAGVDPGLFELESLSAITEDSIFVADGTRIDARGEILLSAGVTGLPSVETTVFGRLVFEDGPGTTALSANRIILNAGPTVALSNPDLAGDDDSAREPIDDALLPSIDFSGLDALTRTGDLENSLLAVQQSASLDLAEDADLDGDPDFDLLRALASRANTNRWETFDLSSVQGDLEVDGLEVLAGVTRTLLIRPGTEDDERGRAIVNIPGPTQVSPPFDVFPDLVPFTGFDDFAGSVEIESNDVTFQTSDPGTSIDLASSKLRLVSDDLRGAGGADERRLALRDESEPLRPIVRIRQAADFTSTELPRPDQYFVTRLVQDPITFAVTEEVVQRSSLEGLDIALERTEPGGTLTFDDALRERVTTAHLILASAGDVSIELTGATPGSAELERAALQLASLDVRTGFDASDPDPGPGTGLIRFALTGFPAPGSPFTGDDAPPGLSTRGDQRFDGDLELATSLDSAGRDIRITGDVLQSDPEAGLTLRGRRRIVLEGDVGGPGPGEALAHLSILFDPDAPESAHVELGRREDLDGDGFAETPIDSGLAQTIRVRDDIVFRVDSPEARRTRSSPFATVGKGAGDLVLESTSGSVYLGAFADPTQSEGFVAGAGEKLSVAGTATITAPDGRVVLGDVSALALRVTAPEIFLLRRSSGIFTDLTGETQPDSGPSISANSIAFVDPSANPIRPRLAGRGEAPIFGVPDPFDPGLPGFLDGFSVFALQASGDPLERTDFSFRPADPALQQRIPILPPLGASRSDLSGAFGPIETPTPIRRIPEPRRLENALRLRELDVDPRETPSSVRRARLQGAAVIDDLRLRGRSPYVRVTEARIDAEDAEEAIALYAKVFGPEGGRTDEVRAILQEALDRYLETTRARRVIGFELRRFVKNRPSTLFDAYQTLEQLDELFRFHRRLGLSPGEYRPIQQEWLRQIQPDGITLDELSEAIHPSRYVRGSDILDIFGR